MSTPTTAFVRSKEVFKVGTAVVLFRPPNTGKSVYEGNRDTDVNSTNPYVQLNDEPENPDAWTVTRGIVRHIETISAYDVVGFVRESLERSYNVTFFGGEPVGRLTVDWENGRVNSYIAGQYQEEDIWTMEEYDRYCRILTEKAVLGSDFKAEEFDKVIMSDANRKDIIAVLKQHQHSRKIFETWGLGEVIEYGKGMTMLFWGPPGTGKTWASNCIAKALGKELKVIDTAQLQTSEPGGMERNLKGVFAEAKKKKQVLLIDECDSLIQQRDGMGMILSAEINCLLTELEQFEGIVILSTNRVNELDKALQRRISLIVEFPKPDAAQRQQIWKRLLPPKMPLAADVNVERLANDFDITGGYIKNAVLNAARFAVSDDKEAVDMEHFLRALDKIAQGDRAFSKPRTVLHGHQQVVRSGMGVGKTKDVAETEVEMTESEVDKVLTDIAKVEASNPPAKSRKSRKSAVAA